MIKFWEHLGGGGYDDTYHSLRIAEKNVRVVPRMRSECMEPRACLVFVVDIGQGFFPNSQEMRVPMMFEQVKSQTELWRHVSDGD